MWGNCNFLWYCCQPYLWGERFWRWLAGVVGSKNGNANVYSRTTDFERTHTFRNWEFPTCQDCIKVLMEQNVANSQSFCSGYLFQFQGRLKFFSCGCHHLQLTTFLIIHLDLDDFYPKNSRKTNPLSPFKFLKSCYVIFSIQIRFGIKVVQIGSMLMSVRWWCLKESNLSFSEKWNLSNTQIPLLQKLQCDVS